MTSLLTRLPSIVMTSTEWGCSRWRVSARAVLARMSTRLTFMPPPVDPAHAPMAIRMSSTVLENSGHFAKSAVPKPVVVMTEPTEKATWWIVWNTVEKNPPVSSRLALMRTMAPKMMIKYQRTSLLCHASLKRRRSRKKYTEKFTPNRTMNTVVTACR